MDKNKQQPKKSNTPAPQQKNPQQKPAQPTMSNKGPMKKGCC